MRRGELLALRVDSIPMREEHWVIADLLGKAGHIHTVPIPGWVKVAVDEWKDAGTRVTGRYLGCKQKLRCAVNDRIGIEPDDAR